MRKWIRFLTLLTALGLAVGAVAAALWTGVLGKVVLDAATREPVEQIRLAPGRAVVLDVAGRECPGDEPALPATPDQWQAIVGEFTWSKAKLSAGSSLAGISLLVAPAATCLSPAEAAVLRGYVRDGGGLLAAGVLGVRHARGNELGWGLAKELLGAERFQLLSDERHAFVAFRAGSPLAAGLEALSLAPPRRGRILAVVPGLNPYWSDAQLQPVDPRLPQAYQSAALTSTFGRGRIAWLGFAVVPGSSGAEASRERRLLRNATAWAAGRPVVSLAQWPGRHRSAVLLRANVAGRPRNAAFVARTLLDAQVRGAFVVPEASLDDLDGLEPPLSRAGELAMLPEPGAPSESVLANAARRLRIRRILGGWASGLLARDGSEEEAALATAVAQLDFFLTEGMSGGGRPTIWRATWRFGPWRKTFDVVGLGRRGDDDLGLSPLGFDGLEPQWLRRRLLADFELSAALGGLHVLSFHTQGLGAPERVATLSWLVAEFAARDAWIAGPAELADWVRARAGLEMIVDASTAGRLSVVLRASAKAPREPVAVELHAPPGTHAVVEAGSTDCVSDETSGGGPARLLLGPGAGAHDYRCAVAFVP